MARAQLVVQRRESADHPERRTERTGRDFDIRAASFGNYESALGTIPLSEPPRFFEPSPVPTLALYGPDDHVLFRDFPERCEVAFPDLVGPFIAPRSGHFLQWERAELLNRAITAFCRDLLG